MVLPLVAFGALTAWFTWPLARIGSNHLISPGTMLLNDLYLILWMLTWVGRALVTDPSTIFDGNALHPTPQVIAASEHLLGDMPIFVPIWLATDNTVLGLNCLTAASFVLSGFFAYRLMLAWTGSRVAAWSGGIAFAFAPWRVGLGRPHLLQAQYLPLIVLALDRTAHDGRMRSALLAAAALAIQVLCSYYLGYAAYVVVGLYLVVWLVADRGRSLGRVWAALAVALLGPLLLIVPASLPYLTARAGGGLTTDLSAPLLAAWGAVGRPDAVLASFAGWGTVVLAVLGVAGWLAAWRARPATRVPLAADPGVERGDDAGGDDRAALDARRSALRVVFLLLVALTTLLLAAGPQGLAGGWRSPYAWLAAVVPGFASLRSPIRFAIATSFALAGLAAYGAAALDLHARRVAPWLRAALLGLAVALPAAWLTTGKPTFIGTRVALRDEISPAHRWLATHGEGGPLLELPIDPMLNVGSARAMFLSTYHWLPLINGYTGYTPPGSAFLLAHAQQLPSAEALQRLVDCAGVEWILVHRATAVRDEAWRKLNGVRLEREFPRGAKRSEGDQLFRVVAAKRAEGCPGLFTPGTTVDGNPVATVAAPRGSIAAALPPIVLPNHEDSVVLSVRNDGPETWPATSTDASMRFELAYAWQPEAGETGRWTRILLPRDLGPGARVDFPAWIASPGTAGRYVLHLRAGQGMNPSAPLLWQQAVDVAIPGAAATAAASGAS